MNSDWKTQQFFRMWPRALFHMPKGKEFLEHALKQPGVYVLYRDEEPYYIGKTKKPLFKRLRTHSLRPNTRYYNFWTYFSAFEISEETHRDEVEAILISAMPTANSSRPKFDRKRLERDAAQFLNDFQALKLTGQKDQSEESHPEETPDEDDE
jgi:hypothetical protein